MTRTLIAGTCYIDTDIGCRVAEIWGKIVCNLNPNCDRVLIDAASPMNPFDFMPWFSSFFHFTDNPGHLSRGGKDGAGRSLVKAWELAIDGGYDYCVHWEADTLLAKPIQVYVNRMARNGTKVAALPLYQYQFPGWEIAIFSVPYLKESRLIERYCWESARKWPIPEKRLEMLTEDELFLLPLYGVRNDQEQCNPANLAMRHPYAAPDWITRITDIRLAHKFLELNGIVLP